MVITAVISKGWGDFASLISCTLLPNCVFWLYLLPCSWWWKLWMGLSIVLFASNEYETLPWLLPLSDYCHLKHGRVDTWWPSYVNFHTLWSTINIFTPIKNVFLFDSGLFPFWKICILWQNMAIQHYYLCALVWKLICVSAKCWVLKWWNANFFFFSEYRIIVVNIVSCKKTIPGKKKMVVFHKSEF